MEPSECRAIIDYLKTNKTNQTFGDLAKVLEAAGFAMHARTAGSHRIFKKPGCFQSPSIPEGRGNVLPAYVRAVIRTLEECCNDNGS